ncbi:unnamed protein product [Phaedon cochleariae]|uniref:Breast cancer type 2 susceptibility protein n=1 Tax=Phaedon cochleariae TaxID=80249 RepID=A0A9P0DFQ6_PHACE|nr:unnamed protein product [Phaedon cochleariae]
MEGSSNPINLKEEDCEVEKTFSEPFDLDLTVPNDKPLSPVLMSRNLNRKQLFGMKTINRKSKSRMRLNERFEESTKGSIKLDNRLKDEQVDTKSQFSEQDFTLSQTENILSCLDRLEEIQRNRKQAYKLVVSSKNGDFCFKKPISPAPKKLKGPHTVSENNTSSEFNRSETSVLENEEENYMDKFVSLDKDPTEFVKCTGFQTATGKAISISESDIKKHADLFDESIARKNKYNFLARNRNCSTEISGFSKDTLIPKSIPDGNENISLTQEICESGISNTQMMVAAETILNQFYSEIKTTPSKISPTDEFKEFRGFNEIEISESSDLMNNFNDILNNIQSVNNNISNKRVYSVLNDDHNYPQRKKLKQDIPDQSVPCSSEYLISEDRTNSMLVGMNEPLGFSCASGKIISRTLNKVENSFPDDKSINSSNHNIAVEKKSENTLKQNSVKNKLKFFDDLIGDTENVSIGFQTGNDIGFSRPLGNSSGLTSSIKPLLRNGEEEKPSNGVKNKLAFFDRMLDNTEFDDMPIANKNKHGFSSASGRTVFSHIQNLKPTKNSPVTAQEDCKNKLKMLDTGIGMAETNNNMSPAPASTFMRGFSTASGKSYLLSENALNKASALFNDLNDDCETNTPQKHLPTATNLQRKETYDTPKRKKPFESLSAKRSNRKLGIASCKPLAISAEKLNMAKQMFEDEFCSVSPIKPIQNISNTSTPLQKHYGTPIRTNVATRSLKTFTSETLTATEMILEDHDDVEYKLAEDSVVTFVDSEDKSGLDLAGELENECKRLEVRLRIVKERHKALASLGDIKMGMLKKPCPGKLYEQKARKDRIPIATVVNGQMNSGTSDLFFITPQNAVNIHFKESSSVVVTQDGATLIPNSKDLIGLREIESSIKCMPCVEERLIPKDWIRNHYKWIIWKLASYERMFPASFKGYLNVEYLIQQLKYRYDREIDKAERPALKRICEKDDAPQKRMVLCVSDIKKVESGRFELELTDGWYGIRTVIDDPLCNQVRNKKIKIGTKLIISGAELMNCDGCSPLEVTNLCFLKINYNSVRRAIWSARLGYQRFPGPFPIQIRTVLPTGGPIGAIEICIARIYPVKYLEKIDGRAVWRNKRSEERSAQAWEIEQSRRMEQIEERIRKEFSDVKVVDRKKANGVQDISKINNPELLMEIIENSNDPDSIQEKLSSSQRLAVLEHRQKSFARKLQEMSDRAKMDANKLEVAKRDVVSVLKMLVVDINGSPTTAFNFFVWRPTESHFQILREGACVKAYNVIPRMNGDLTAGKKTLFRCENGKDQMSDIFKRKVIEISEISDMRFSSNFSEFDTVGLVVGMKIEENHQEIWLSDVTGRLLLVEIFEGPSTCLLLDKLKRGQPTSVCNLTYKGSKQEFARASANHFSIFSSYSQFRHLQEGLEEFQKLLPKDCDELQQDCDKKIKSFNMSPNTSEIVLTSYMEDCDEDVLVPSRITSTDIALSLLDIDKLS